MKYFFKIYFTENDLPKSTHHLTNKKPWYHILLVICPVKNPNIYLVLVKMN